MGNVYLWKANGQVIFHANLQSAERLDNLTRAPDKTVTAAEWDAAEGLARIIDGEIFLGKTEEEIEKKSLAAEERELMKELADKDYKVTKNAEKGLVLAEVDPVLHQRREWCRSRINEIREIIDQ